ncbi:MAG: FAD:protein FMN transferase [Candidatus Limnocylindria bacterium]
MLAWQRSEALECVKFRSMGTEVVVLLPPNHQRDAGRVRSLFEAWDARFSRFDPSSELSRVNGRAGHAVRVSPVMLEAVRVAVRAAHATNGTFDPLLGARMIELGYDRTFATIDPRPRPASGWVPVRWEAIEIDQPAGSLRIPQRTALDLGGIAKGMAVDAAIADLRGAGIAHAGVNAAAISRSTARHPARATGR